MRARVAIVTNRIPGYRYAVFRRVVSSGDFDIRFLLSQPLSHSDQRAIREFSCEYTSSVHISRTMRHGNSGTTQTESISIPWRLCWDLFRYRPAIVISGEMGARSLISFIICRIIGAQFVIWTEEIESTAQGIGFIQQRLRRFFAHRADAFLSWGAPSVRYLEKLGIAAARIKQVPQAAEADLWEQQARLISRDTERAASGLSGTVLFFCGQLIERKGIRQFLRAFEAVKKCNPCVTCLIAGDGELSQELKTLVGQQSIRDVRFAGQLDALGLARCYAMADALVFPSLADVWGMVVNEALYFNLYIVGSGYAGACQQLLEGSTLGEIIDPTDHRAFEEVLGRIASSPPRPSRSEQALLLETLSPQRAAIAILEILTDLVSRLPTSGVR